MRKIYSFQKGRKRPKSGNSDRHYVFPVGLVDGAAQDERLEVGEGEGDGERVQAAVPQHHATHLAL